MAKKLPKKLYIKIDGDPGEEFYNASDELFHLVEMERTQTDVDLMELDAALNLASGGRHWMPTVAARALERLMRKHGSYTKHAVPMVLAKQPDTSATPKRGR